MPHNKKKIKNKDMLGSKKKVVKKSKKGGPSAIANVVVNIGKKGGGSGSKAMVRTTAPKIPQPTNIYNPSPQSSSMFNEKFVTSLLEKLQPKTLLTHADIPIKTSIDTQTEPTISSSIETQTEPTISSSIETKTEPIPRLKPQIQPKTYPPPEQSGFYFGEEIGSMLEPLPEKTMFEDKSTLFDPQSQTRQAREVRTALQISKAEAELNVEELKVGYYGEPNQKGEKKPANTTQKRYMADNGITTESQKQYRKELGIKKAVPSSEFRL